MQSIHLQALIILCERAHSRKGRCGGVEAYFYKPGRQGSLFSRLNSLNHCHPLAAASAVEEKHKLGILNKWQHVLRLPSIHSCFCRVSLGLETDELNPRTACIPQKCIHAAYATKRWSETDTIRNGCEVYEDGIKLLNMWIPMPFDTLYSFLNQQAPCQS